MVLILLSIILAAIAVAVSTIHTSFGVLAASGIVKENFSIVKKRAEQPTITSSMKQFLVVVLADGTIVTPRVAERL